LTVYQKLSPEKPKVSDAKELHL